MTLTATDLFCGAGGSSLGAQTAGVELSMAANHWATAIAVHQAHFPHARHDLADISQVDPRRYPRTDILIASPECTNHSRARGVSRRRQDPTLWDAPDPAAERSRATMWDVVRFAEQMIYAAIVVENVVEVTRWVLFPAWLQAMESLGYERQILSHNAMHFGVPQSRDRVYMVFWRPGIRPNLEMELDAYCDHHGATTVRQAWNRDRSVGRYQQQWHWHCIRCRPGKAARCVPPVRPASDIIDWSLPCLPIGQRKDPLVDNTRFRILAGLIKYGWVPVVTAGAGNGHERTPGNRARPLTAPLRVVSTTAEHALATPPAFMVQPNHGGDDNCRTRSVDQALWTVAASDDRPAMVVPLRNNGRSRPVDEALPTVAAGGNHHGLLMRNNGGGAEMVTPTSEAARTVTMKGHQSLLLPYYNGGVPRPVDQPVGAILTKDHWALLTPDEQAVYDEVIDACGFRMLEPPEVAGAQAFPPGYIPLDLPKKHQIALAGNGVPPPKMAWVVGRVVQALEAA